MGQHTLRVYAADILRCVTNCPIVVLLQNGKTK